MGRFEYYGEKGFPGVDLSELKGKLIVTGRLKDLLIVRGLKHYPQDLELTAERQHVALRSGCAAAFALDEEGRDDVAIAIEVDPRALSGDREERTEQLHDIVAAVRGAVTEEHGIMLGAVSLLSIGTIPKTSSGKLRRHACRQGFIDQTLDEMTRWTRHPDASEAARPDASAASGGSGGSLSPAAVQQASRESDPSVADRCAPAPSG
jgi:acyl-CoA synthetase (AMP-forming)/AMP-acid ligase II